MKKTWKRGLCLFLSVVVILTGNAFGMMRLPGNVEAYASIVEQRPYYPTGLTHEQYNADAVVNTNGNSLDITFHEQYAQVHFFVPKTHFDASTIEGVTFNTSYGDNSNMAVKLMKEDTQNSSGEFAVAYNTNTVSKANDGTEIVSVVLMNMSEGEYTITVDGVVFGLNKSTGYEDDGGTPALKDSISSLGGLGYGTRTGVCIPVSALTDDTRMEMVTKHYNLVTCENEMKPEVIMGRYPSYNAETGFINLDFSEGDKLADYLLKYNKEHGTDIKMRGHVLVWHSQTPDGFFRIDYDTSKGYTTKEEMLRREKQYIKAVFEHYGTGTKYENLFYCWDVVNETIDDSTNKIRTDESGAWYKVFSGDNTFIKQAFVFANQYAPKHVKLFYNDYNDDNPGKRQAICNLLDAIRSTDGARIDGMGMQAHYGVSYTSITNVENAIVEYSKRVSEVQFTELDFQTSNDYDGSNPQAEYELMASKYKQLYEKILELNRSGKSNVTAIVFWGTDDGHSWLNSAAGVGGGADGKRPQCPMLFDADYQAKPAYWVFINGSKDIQKLSTEANQTNESALAREYTFNNGANTVSIYPMWSADGFAVKALVRDSTVDEQDQVVLFAKIADEKKTITVNRSEATAVSGGYEATLQIPASGLNLGDKISYDIQVKNGNAVASFGDVSNKQNQKDDFYVEATLKAAPSYITIPKGTITVDGEEDLEWQFDSAYGLDVKNDSPSTTTEAKLLWDEENLYVLMKVQDTALDRSNAEAYLQDSVEVFIDENNHKTSRYEADDKQYRVNFANSVTLNGEKCAGNIVSAVKVSGTEYLVEMALKWTDIVAAENTYIGLDLQNNDAKAGERIGTANLFDNSGKGYQDTSVYGIAKLIGENTDVARVKNVIDLIGQIGTVNYSDASKTAISKARSAYNALTASLKEKVSNYDLLTKAEEDYQTKKTEKENQDAIDKVIGLINQIGKVTYSTESKSKIDIAKEAYENLSEDLQKKVTNYSVLAAAETAYADAKTAKENQDKVDSVKNLIDAIGEVTYSQGSKTAIDRARNAYDALEDTLKSNVTNYETLTSAEKAYVDAEIDAIDQAEIGIVENKINTIGTVSYTDSCKDKIDDAKTAYNNLNDRQKGKFDSDILKKLTDAENAYLEAKAAAEQAERDRIDLEAIGNVQTIVDAISGSSDNLDTQLGLIERAEEEYNKLSDDQKNRAEGVALLTAIQKAREDYQKAKDEADRLKKETEDQAAADIVISAINEIGTAESVRTDLENGENLAEKLNQYRQKIEAAELAYSQLTDDQKAIVDSAKGTLLTNVRAIYDEKKTAYDNAKSEAERNQAAADYVIGLINAIGTVDASAECKNKIDIANNAYGALTNDAQKALVTNYATLTNAIATYNEKKAEADAAAQKEAEDTAAANTAMAFIDAIKPFDQIDGSDACKSSIEAARNVYEKLTDDQKNKVTAEKLATLANAENKFSEIKIAEAQEKINKLDTITSATSMDDRKAWIEDAKNAYDALTDDQKKEVSNADKIESAQASYEQAKKDAEEEAIYNAVIVYINAIGTVDGTDATLKKIEAAENAFNSLTPEQQSAFKVKKAVAWAKLDSSRKNYEIAKKAAADQAAIDVVLSYIRDIGTVDGSDACKARIDAARGAYDNLTDDQKAAFNESDLNILKAAESSYQVAIDQAAISDVILRINAIGTIDTSDTCKARIDAARTAYNKLTDSQKAKFEGAGAENADILAILVAAEKDYAKLVEEENNQGETDITDIEVKNVVELIQAIGTVDGSAESEAKVRSARAAYDALSQDKKNLIGSVDYVTLTSAENALEKELTVKHVISLIDAIGEVEATDECNERILAARNAYNALTLDLKKKVSAVDLETLANAENTYITKKTEKDDKAAIDAVVGLIEAIGEVTYSDASKAKIDAAREAYEALNDSQKGKFDATKLNALTDAEKEYQSAKAEADAAAKKEADDIAAANSAMELIDAIKPLDSIDGSDACKISIEDARNAYEALTADQKSKVTLEKLTALEKAENKFSEIKIAEAEEKINKLDTITAATSMEDRKSWIEDAKNAYEALTDDQKKKVLNADKIELAEKNYEQDKKDAQEAEKPDDQPDKPGQEVKPDVPGGQAGSTEQKPGNAEQKPEPDPIQYFAKFSAKSTDIEKGKSSTALAKDIEIADGDKIVSWETSNKKIVSVSKSGKIKAVKVGTAVISAKTESGKIAKITVKVKKNTVKTKKVKVVNVSKKKLTLKVKESFILKTKLTPITTSDKLTYKTNNKKVATVSKTGKVTAKKKGTAKITAKAGKKTVTVTVKVE